MTTEMEPERFEAISRIFHAALEFDVERQLEFVRQACGSDESLYREIESLLAYQKSPRTFIDEPALEMAAHLLAKDAADEGTGRLPARVGVLGEGGVHCQKCGATSTPGARFCSACGARIETMQDTVGDPLREALERAIGFQYRIERLLGRGGMGAVYLAHELALDRDVAIKVLPPEQAGAPQLRERFRREARTAARLNHPSIVPLYTFGEVNGLMYFVMGYVAGEPLASKLRRDGPLTSDDARTLFAELADALAYAHRHGVIHRDIKPDNILIDADSGSPRLTDFGIAKATFTDTLLTTAGQLMGTPAYMSPEQARGCLDIDARSDIYSLGVVAYEMVSGRLPFDAKNLMEAVTQRLTREPRPLRALAPNVAADLIVAIQRCLQRDPANRWPDAKSLRVELVPMDDDTDAPAVRLLRFSSMGASLLAPTFVSATTLGLFNSGPIRILAVILAFGLSVLFVLGFGAALALRRQGSGIHAIFQTALRQPRWWKFWYPRRFRRLGDVWDRLPVHMRRVRLHFALVFGFAWGIYLPLWLGFRLSRTLPVMPLALETILFAVLLLAFLERHRATKELAAKLGISVTDASKIMSTPTWRSAVWQREPAASLIRRANSAPAAPSVRPTEATALTQSGDRPTI